MTEAERLSTEDHLLWTLSGLQIVAERAFRISIDPALAKRIVRGYLTLLVMHESKEEFARLDRGEFALRPAAFYPWAIRWLAKE